jgi:AcrR family transcriptional regulator
VDQESRRTRRRGQQLESHILEVAWLELAEHGWARLTMERVAARAGTGKASLYSRWPNKAALIRAATTHAAGTIRAGSANFSCDLEADLLAVLRGSVEVHEGPYGEAVRGLVTEARSTVPEGSSQFTEETPVQSIVDLVTHAQQNGDLLPGQVPVRVLNLGLTLITHYYLLNGTTPDDDALHSIVSDVWLPLLQGSRTEGA